MASDSKSETPLHGEPLCAPSRTGEAAVETPLRVRVTLAFDLDLSKWGGPVIRDWAPPARLVDRAATVLVGGLKALDAPPENPQPNTAIGTLVPPAKPTGSSSS